MSSDESDNDLNAEECQKAVDQFVEVTNTDEALAQFYLQDRDWDAVKSINDYFADIGRTAPSTSEQPQQ